MADASRINFTTAILVLAIWFVGAESKRFHSFAGPYRVHVRRLEKCDDQVTAKVSVEYHFKDLRQKYTDDLIFRGNFTTPHYFNDKLSGRLKFSSWSNMGGWKENAYVFNLKKVCRSLVDVFHPIWESIVINIFGEALACPFYPGIYRFDKMKFDLNSKKPTKEFIYGRWMVDTQILQETGDVYACLRVFADTIPA